MYCIVYCIFGPEALRHNSMVMALGNLPAVDCCDTQDNLVLPRR